MAGTDSVTVRVQRVNATRDADLPLPRQMTAGAAGLDLPAAVSDPLAIAPGGFVAVPTGFRVAFPTGYEGQVRPRSGLAARHGVTCLNTPGTIDADYRGEVKVLLVNHGREPFVVTRGMRIAQMVVMPVPRVGVVEVDTLDETERGAGGFGSTGVDAKPLR